MFWFSLSPLTEPQSYTKDSLKSSQNSLPSLPSTNDKLLYIEQLQQLQQEIISSPEYQEQLRLKQKTEQRQSQSSPQHVKLEQQNQEQHKHKQHQPIQKPPPTPPPNKTVQQVRAQEHTTPIKARSHSATTVPQSPKTPRSKLPHPSKSTTSPSKPPQTPTKQLQQQQHNTTSSSSSPLARASPATVRRSPSLKGNKDSSAVPSQSVLLFFLLLPLLFLLCVD